MAWIIAIAVVVFVYIPLLCSFRYTTIAITLAGSLIAVEVSFGAPAWGIGMTSIGGLFFVVIYWAADIAERQQAKAKVISEATANANAEAKVKAEAEAKAKAKAETEAKAEADAKAEAKREKAQRALLIKEAKRCLHFISETVLAQSLVIDSNIWMNEEYENFFTVLRHCVRDASTQIELPGKIFDELCNLKKDNAYDAPDRKNRKARLAIQRIEDFQKEQLLRIERVTIDSDPRAYADKEIVELMVADAKKGKTLCLISEDKELRIRVREHLQLAAPERFAIIEGKELLEGCAKVIEAESLQLIPKMARRVAVNHGKN